MDSRVAIEAFMKAAPHKGLAFELLPTHGLFNFAKSEKSTVTEKCRVWFCTHPPCWTDFDIVEQGNVPLPPPLPRMQNLRFTLELTPERALLTFPCLRCAKAPVKMSTSRHLVADLADFCWVDPTKSRIIEGTTPNMEFP